MAQPIAAPRHRVRFTYIDADERIVTSGLRIDKLTPDLPRVISNFVTFERQGYLVSFEVTQ